MQSYLNLLEKILSEGNEKGDRTNTGTLSIFGHQIRFDLSKGFPLLTTKKVHMKSVIAELLWFLGGDTNIRSLLENKVNIWNDWRWKCFNEYQLEHLPVESHITEEAFLKQILADEDFAAKWGDIGKGYGHQWRRFGEATESIQLGFEKHTHVIKNGFDQISWVVNEIKNNPNSRRLIVTGWNPNEMNDVDLPQCHTLFQFYVNNNKLSCQLYMRSCDVFLGLPFNIASYGLLLLLVSQVCKMEVGEFIWVGGDIHLYSNHIEQAKLQLTRKPYDLCKVELNKNIDNIFDFKLDDIKVIDYIHHEAIKAPVAV